MFTVEKALSLLFLEALSNGLNYFIKKREDNRKGLGGYGLLVCWPLIRCVEKKVKTHARVRRLNIIPVKYFQVRGRDEICSQRN